VFADFTAGEVIVTLYSKGQFKGNACIQYYTIMGDIAQFLQQAADPVKFMCQVTTCLLCLGVNRLLICNSPLAKPRPRM